jgi:hypothetical protein
VVDAVAQRARTSRFSGLARETDRLHLIFSLDPRSRRRLLAPGPDRLADSEHGVSAAVLAHRYGRLRGVPAGLARSSMRCATPCRGGVDIGHESHDEAQ